MHKDRRNEMAMVQQADFESRAASIGKDQRNVALFPTMAFRVTTYR
jgi:hypothetical protein